MDEIFFHLSQHWETLQIHLTTGIQHGRQLALSFGEQVSNQTQRLWSIAWSEQIRHTAQRCFELFKDAVRRCSVVLAQPSEMYFQLTELVRIEMPILYPGSAGFVTGAAIGLIIGLSWQRNIFPVQRMKAVVCMAYDGLDALSCVDDAIIPTITKPQQVVVQVKSASVDIVDVKICYGYGKTLRRLLSSFNNVYSKSEFPITLGRDCSGIVVEIGPNVNKLEIGDEVWLVSPFWNPGTIAEYVLTTEDMVAKKPKGMGFEAASSIPYSGCLAYNACMKAGIIGNEENGKRILIHSGVSPVGCIACQLARLYNFEVTVTCSARAAPVARALGANHVVIYGQIEMENHLLQDKFDVVLNTVGGVCHESCLKLCKLDGAVVSTVPEEISYDDYMFPMSLIQSVYLKTKYLVKKLSGKVNQWNDTEFSSQVLDKLKILIDNGQLQPVVDKVFSPQDAILALQHCDSADAIGKTVIRFRTRPDYER